MCTMIARTLAKNISKKMHRGKAIILVGARQTGKTTLIEYILEDQDYLFLNGDDPSVRTMLTDVNTDRIRRLIGRHTVVFLDEAQRIPGIGLTLKIITDRFPEVQLLVSGSSSFDMTHQLNEPLTGRKWEYTLFPVSWQEFENHVGYLHAEQQLETRLVYGSYPEVVSFPGEERERLRELAGSYLYRDILGYAGIRKPEVLDSLLLALALQVGGEVNYNELAQTTGLNKGTVANYIDILEKGYIVFRLNSFARNLRTEIKRTRKIYFYDNGVRNAITGNFQPLDLREDKGALWENFLVSERLKYNLYCNTGARMYFWRTRQQQEIDYVEERDGHLTACEFKWKPRKTKVSSSFLSAYDATAYTIHRENFRDFVQEPGPQEHQ
ncbi:MAG: ATP-binding protein [bacterium]